MNEKPAPSLHRQTNNGPDPTKSPDPIQRRTEIRSKENQGIQASKKTSPDPTKSPDPIQLKIKDISSES
jgi:hypothetical protein